MELVGLLWSDVELDWLAHLPVQCLFWDTNPNISFCRRPSPHLVYGAPLPVGRPDDAEGEVERGGEEEQRLPHHAAVRDGAIGGSVDQEPGNESTASGFGAWVRRAINFWPGRTLRIKHREQHILHTVDKIRLWTKEVPVRTYNFKLSTLPSYTEKTQMQRYEDSNKQKVIKYFWTQFVDKV